MIITDSFVHIANPRCGSSFSRKVIRNGFDLAVTNFIVGITFEEYIFRASRGLKTDINDYHGTVRQIPKFARDLPILSSARHPVTLLYSTFSLELWAERMTKDGLQAPIYHSAGWASEAETRLHYAESTMPKRWGISAQEHNIGYLTAHFIAMFSRAPRYVFHETFRGNLSVEILEETIPRIRFHRQEELRYDLEMSLSNWIGRPLAKLAVDIPSSNITNPALSPTSPLNSEFSKNILLKERFLIQFLARRGIIY